MVDSSLPTNYRLWLFVAPCHTCHLITGHGRIPSTAFMELTACSVKSCCSVTLLFQDSHVTSQGCGLQLELASAPASDKIFTTHRSWQFTGSVSWAIWRIWTLNDILQQLVRISVREVREFTQNLRKCRNTFCSEAGHLFLPQHHHVCGKSVLAQLHAGPLIFSHGWNIEHCTSDRLRLSAAGHVIVA